MMNNQRTSQWIMLVAVLLLSGVFLFPLWQITLDAAQFPGGLRLNVWINKFSGDEGEGNIIANINILNHYIGMKFIEPDAIPELKYFPYVIYLMLALGLLTVYFNRPIVYLSWTIILSVLALLGVYDFYLWMYDYGHNLDPNAPIKVPGMTYMPPLFGEKDLLNFYVSSYPRLGTILLGLGIILSFVAYWMSNKFNKMKKLQSQPLIMITLLFSFSACNINTEAVPINFGKDQCDFCKMTISNPKFGAELITDKGRILKYDAAECLINHIHADAPKYQKLYVVPFDAPREMRSVETLQFLISSDFRSPMGANLSAFAFKNKLDKKYHSQLIDWEILLISLKEKS
ncbi:MAG: hypothetical protein WAT92_22250 [Saprospiraceae bacterium]|nr:hypothetical protein [Saprospiraceae bacterium]HMS66638.1 hypothetical protein [Saprospiraceae bacterium]